MTLRGEKTDFSDPVTGILYFIIPSPKEKSSRFLTERRSVPLMSFHERFMTPARRPEGQNQRPPVRRSLFPKQTAPFLSSASKRRRVDMKYRSEYGPNRHIYKFDIYI